MEKIDIRQVNKSDLEQLRMIRNKWQNMGLFRQAHNITKKEQLAWYKENKNNPGYKSSCIFSIEDIPVILIVASGYK